MTADEYRDALAELGLTQQEAADWLGVSLKTSQRYALKGYGPAPTAARALGLVLGMGGGPRYHALRAPIP